MDIDPASATYQVLSSLYLDVFIIKWDFYCMFLRGVLKTEVKLGAVAHA